MPEKNLFALAGPINSRADFANNALFGTPQAGNALNFGKQLPSIGRGLDLQGLAAADKKTNPWNYADDIDTTFQYIKGANAGQFKVPEQGAQKVTVKPSAMQAAGMVASALGSIKTGDPRGMWDTLDPVYHLAGGRESAAGNAMSDAGVTLTQAGLSSGQPYLALAGAALKVVGGLTNAAFGIKEDKKKKEMADWSIGANRNFTSNALSFDDIKGPASMTNTNIYENGWFTNAADDKNRKYAEDMTNAYSWADRSVINNISNIANDQMSDSLRNYSAFGGPIDVDPSTAIGYSIYTDKFIRDK